MTRLVLREVARWGRAVGAPLVVLAIVTFGPALSPFGSVWLVPDRALSIGWLAAVIAALSWLSTSAIRAALQPVRDRRAAEYLQRLRDRAAGPNARLLCVERSLWQSPAGQRLVAADVQIGTVFEVWLGESALPTGAFALVTTARESTLVDWISPGDVAAARRAERSEAARHRARVAQATSLAASRERKAAADVVRA